VLLTAARGECLRFIGLIFRLLPTPLPFHALSEGDLLELSVHIWYGKTRIARLQAEGRMMIDSVVLAQYINVTDTKTTTQPRRHSISRPNALRWVAKVALESQIV